MEKIDYLIGKYITNEASDSERKTVEKWLEESNENRIVFQQIKSFWEDSHENLEKLQKSSWENITKKITSDHINTSYPINGLEEKTIKKNKRAYWAWAAVIAALLAFTPLLWQKKFGDASQNEIVKMAESTTQKGQKLTLKLADGSKVILNSGSKLIYPVTFSGKTRHVTLVGEAFFEVTPNAALPFIISTGKINTKVLGTSFNIYAPANNNEVRVAVATGKVKVTDTIHKKEVYLLPEDMAIVLQAEGEISKTKFDYNEVFGWKDGKLVFSGANLQSILATLENWYGFSFEKAPNFKIDDVDDYYSSFQDESIQNVMENLSHTYDFSYKINYQTKTVTLMEQTHIQ